MHVTVVSERYRKPPALAADLRGRLIPAAWTASWSSQLTLRRGMSRGPGRWQRSLIRAVNGTVVATTVARPAACPSPGSTGSKGVLTTTPVVVRS